jgi:hypothetical protein
VTAPTLSFLAIEAWACSNGLFNLGKRGNILGKTETSTGIRHQKQKLQCVRLTPREEQPVYRSLDPPVSDHPASRPRATSRQVQASDPRLPTYECQDWRSYGLLPHGLKPPRRRDHESAPLSSWS